MGPEGEFEENLEINEYLKERIPGSEELTFKAKGFILAERKPINLCPICTKSPMTCESELVRLVEVPAHLETKTTPKNKIVNRYKIVDGVAEGIITSEDQFGPMRICDWFQLKELG